MLFSQTEKRRSAVGGSDLGDAQPVVRQLHGLRGVLHWFHWVPGLPVGAQACEGRNRRPSETREPGPEETTGPSPVPGAQLSTSAPSARPLLQSRLKLVMGRSGTLFWIQPRRRCLGVFDSAWKERLGLGLRRGFESGFNASC